MHSTGTRNSLNGQEAAKIAHSLCTRRRRGVRTPADLPKRYIVRDGMREFFTNTIIVLPRGPGSNWLSPRRLILLSALKYSLLIRQLLH